MEKYELIGMVAFAILCMVIGAIVTLIYLDSRVLMAIVGQTECIQKDNSSCTINTITCEYKSDDARERCLQKIADQGGIVIDEYQVEKVES